MIGKGAADRSQVLEYHALGVLGHGACPQLGLGGLALLRVQLGDFGGWCQPGRADDARAMLLEGLAYPVFAKAGVNLGCAGVAVIQHAADKVQAVTSLGEPASDRPPQVMQSHIVDRAR